MAQRARRQVVVVGSGVAGLLTALHAAARHDVVLVTAGRLESGNTVYAQGGIAAAIGARDSVDSHVEDTVRAGAGLCDLAAVTAFCRESPARIRELIRLGVPFDGTPDGPALALEAAHSAPRILHAGGDATGAAIAHTLAGVVRRTVADVREHVRLDEILVEGGCVTGVRLTSSTGTAVLHADAVVVATGGFAGLYAHSSNPPSTTGTGIAAAVRAGAAVADLEFVQFHPTVLARSGGFLISEAVRGEGAVLRNERGERFMTAVHPDAELAPRDVVARAIAREMIAQDGRPVLLDVTHIDAEHLDARFPGIAGRVREAGIDWSAEPVPVTPAAHYTMGGVITDLAGRSTVPGLSVVGEAARTGVHGANRLASNSLAEAAVFAARAAADLDRADRAPLRLSEPPTALRVPSASASAAGPADVSAVVRESLWNDVGLVRSEAGLSRTLETLSTLEPADARDRDAVLVAFLTASAARCRRESRGAHNRSDHPDVDPPAARPHAFGLVGAPASRVVDPGVEPGVVPLGTSAHQEALAC